MDSKTYLRSLGEEVRALQARVRYLIADAHWQTDGEWKESVIRQILRRQLPATVAVSRGFVLTPTNVSSQIDILIHDSMKPVLFRDGDLVFVTPDAVLGLIEVKSSTTPAKFGQAARKLGSAIELVRLHPNSEAFAGIFSFEAETSSPLQYLSRLANSAPTWNHRLNIVALGDSHFIRYWNETPTPPTKMYERWHMYELSMLAAGYFVHNVVEAISPNSVLPSNAVWFPEDSKEPSLIGDEPGRWV